jgi:hypothetical protein
MSDGTLPQARSQAGKQVLDAWLLRSEKASATRSGARGGRTGAAGPLEKRSTKPTSTDGD